MDPRQPEIQGSMEGCGGGKVIALLACIGGLLLAAVFIAGWITVAEIVSANQ